MTLADFTALFKKELHSLFQENELRNHIVILYDFYLGLDRAQTVLNANLEVNNQQAFQLISALEELKNHKPIDYIINQSIFYGREYYVDESVLIPRSETEELVQWILEEEKTDEKIILDIGSGSGCIPITLYLEGNFKEVDAVEISTEANVTARRNAESLGAKVTFEDLDILTQIPKRRYDIVVSNPPYVKEEELQSLDKNVVEYEPTIALAPKGDPLTFYKRMIEIAPQMLKEGGRLYWEIHEDLGKEIVELLKGARFSEVQLREDLYGRDRLVKATFG